MTYRIWRRMWTSVACCSFFVRPNEKKTSTDWFSRKERLRFYKDAPGQFPTLSEVFPPQTYNMEQLIFIFSAVYCKQFSWVNKQFT